MTKGKENSNKKQKKGNQVSDCYISVFSAGLSVNGAKMKDMKEKSFQKLMFSLFYFNSNILKLTKKDCLWSALI